MCHFYSPLQRCTVWKWPIHTYIKIYIGQLTNCFTPLNRLFTKRWWQIYYYYYFILYLYIYIHIKIVPELRGGCSNENLPPLQCICIYLWTQPLPRQCYYINNNVNSSKMYNIYTLDCILHNIYMNIVMIEVP